MKRNIPEFKYIDAWQILCREGLNGTIVDDKSMGKYPIVSNFGRRQAGVTLSLTWLRAEKPAHSALISGFEHLLGIIMEKLCFYWHFSILSPELCFFSWIQAEFRMKYALPTRLR